MRGMSWSGTKLNRSNNCADYKTRKISGEIDRVSTIMVFFFNSAGVDGRCCVEIVLNPYDGLRGTFAPARRASESPIAIACLRLLTFLPDLPDLSVPSFISWTARSTFCEALGPYFLPRDLAGIAATLLEVLSYFGIVGCLIPVAIVRHIAEAMRVPRDSSRVSRSRIARGNKSLRRVAGLRHAG
jgi:hypothetical protein